jgi:hypothetical protein
MIEQFEEKDLNSLRDELLISGLDDRQMAEVISCFLNLRGYGASRQDLIAKIRQPNVYPFPSPKLQEVLQSCAHAAA